MNGPTYVALMLCVASVHGLGDDALTKLFGEYWQWFLGEFPEFAAKHGYRRWNSMRESYNISAYTRRKETVESYLDRLKTIHRDHLSREAQVNYDILEDNLQTYINGFRFFRYGAINPVMAAKQYEYKSIASGYEFRSKQDFEDYISRIIATRKQLEEIMDLSREAIRLGRTFNAVSLTPAPGHIDEFLTSDPQQFIVYKPFNETLDQITSISDQDK